MKSNLTDAANSAMNAFSVQPNHPGRTMTKKDVRSLLLYTDGWMMSCGFSYDIESKHLGAGVYKVRLKARNR